LSIHTLDKLFRLMVTIPHHFISPKDNSFECGRLSKKDNSCTLYVYLFLKDQYCSHWLYTEKINFRMGFIRHFHIKSVLSTITEMHFSRKLLGLLIAKHIKIHFKTNVHQVNNQRNRDNL